MNTKDSCRRYIESHLTRSVILPCRGLEDPTDRHDSEKPRSVPWFTDKIGEFLQTWLYEVAVRVQIPVRVHFVPRDVSLSQFRVPEVPQGCKLLPSL
jgi:hypothetical protein